MDQDSLKSDRIEAALRAVIDGAAPRVLFDLLDRASGMPGPRPKVDVLRAFGSRIASEGQAGEEIVEELLTSSKTSLFYIGCMALAAVAVKHADRRSLSSLMQLADETVKERRDAVISAIAVVLAERGDAAAVDIRPLADGYLHAFVALEALTQPRSLSEFKSSDSVLDVLSDAFATADEAPRSADRSQGLRVLRQGMPVQIARTTSRFSNTLDFLRERTSATRPETREIISESIKALRKIVGEAEAERLRLEFEGFAKPPRDPSRIVKGTRKRSRGR